MQRPLFWLVLLSLATVLGPAPSYATLSEDDFRIQNAQDLVDLCTAAASDPLRDAAIHFCHGFASGAWQYHEAQASGPDGIRLVCLRDPRPTRDAAIASFVEWAGTHPEHMSEPAVEALFRFLVERWPCPETAAKGGAK